MKTLIHRTRTMPREDVQSLLVIVLATLAALAGTAVFFSWATSSDHEQSGLQPFLLSLLGALIYSALMGAVLYLFHPHKGLIFAKAKDRRD